MAGWQCDSCHRANKRRAKTCAVCGARKGALPLRDPVQLFDDGPPLSDSAAAAPVWMPRDRPDPDGPPPAWNVPDRPEPAMPPNALFIGWDPGAPAPDLPPDWPPAALQPKAPDHARTRRITHIWTLLALPAVVFFFAVAGLAR